MRDLSKEKSKVSEANFELKQLRKKVDKAELLKADLEAAEAKLAEAEGELKQMKQLKKERSLQLHEKEAQERDLIQDVSEQYVEKWDLKINEVYLKQSLKSIQSSQTSPRDEFSRGQTRLHEEPSPLRKSPIEQD